MKKIIFILFILPLFASAQEATHFEIIEHGADFDIIKATIAAPQFLEVATPNGIQKKVSLQKGSQLLEKGAPDIPKLAFSLMVPNNMDGEIDILSSKYHDITNINIAPSKGKIYRHENPNDFPFEYGDVYSRNDFYPSQTASLFTPYILRDVRGQAVHLFPIKYNPVTKTLRAFTEIIFKVSYTKAATENVLASFNEFPATINNEFAEIYKYQFLNYKTLAGSYSPLPQTGKLLILCPSKYESALTDFIEWKERKGYKVLLEITDTMSGGVTEVNVLNRVTQYYQQQQIAYLLIVGDATDIPARNSYWTVPGLWGPSDWAYAYQTGNDHYPDLIVGRFSADTLQHVLTQVKRTLLYERQANVSTNWMQKQIAMGSNQGPGDKGEYDHVHLRGIADSNKNYGPYVYNYEMYDGDQGGNDANGSPTAANVITAINAGVGLINYCGHGTVDRFSTSSFSGLNDVPNLTNSNGEWPFVFSTACINGSFIYSTCLAESLLRASDGNGNPQGAVATIMSSINQSWDPPMQGQDEMNAILRHARPGTYQTTFGAITTSGIMSTNDHYNTNIDPDGGNEIADTWIVFADPTIVLRTDNSGVLSCAHNPTIGLNSTSFEINSAEENAQLGLYFQGEFLASAVVKNGKAVFSFPALQHLDTIYVTGTKQNLAPYYGFVEVVNGTPFGISELAKEGIRVYPNPTADILKIDDQDFKVQSAEIIDISGKKLLTSIEKTINVSHLPIGVYQLKLIMKDKVLFTKFSKK